MQSIDQTERTFTVTANTLNVPLFPGADIKDIETVTCVPYPSKTGEKGVQFEIKVTLTPEGTVRYRENIARAQRAWFAK